MKPIERLKAYIKDAHPQATVTMTPALSDDGVWFLDVSCGDKQLAIEWSHATGYGVSSLINESYGERPDEAFTSADDVQRRVTELLTSNERTSPPLGVLLSRLRELRGCTQQELASKLGVRQATVSGMERRVDIQFSTLRRVIRALSGSLEIFVVFPEARYRIWPCSVDCNVDEQSLLPSHGHTDLSAPNEALDLDYEARFEALSKSGQLLRARRVGKDISERHMVWDMAA